MKVVKNNHIVDAYQFSIKSPRDIPGIVGPDRIGQYKVQIMGGTFRTLNEGDFVLRDEISVKTVMSKMFFMANYSNVDGPAGDYDPKKHGPKLRNRFDLLKDE